MHWCFGSETSERRVVAPDLELTDVATVLELFHREPCCLKIYRDDFLTVEAVLCAPYLQHLLELLVGV